MCTSIIEIARAEGMAKRGDDWFPLSQAVVAYDHARHAPLGDVITLDFINTKLDPGARPGLKRSVDEVERDHVAERRMTRMVVGDHRMRERKPLVAALGHAFRRRDLDDGRAHISASYFARCLPRKANVLLQPSIACSGRYSGRCQ